MRIACISDTHLFHQRTKPEIQEAWASSLKYCDMVVHAGDFTGRGTIEEVASAASWYRNLLPPIKLCVPGNHDFLFEKEEKRARGLFHGIHVLINEFIEIEGKKFWGSPVSPRFFDWAFNVDRGEPIKKYWDKIPYGLDMLITHGPPHGILDDIEGRRVGCEELLKTVFEKKPKVHVVGHIHASYGAAKYNDITFINAASLNESYNLANYPIIVDI